MHTIITRLTAASLRDLVPPAPTRRIIAQKRDSFKRAGEDLLGAPTARAERVPALYHRAA